MKKKIQLLSSGISLVDSGWGGFYRGGTYMMIGAHKTGKTLLGLQFANECASQKEVCLYFTSKRPKDLIIQAASIDFDLQEYMNRNLVIVVRVTPPSDLNTVPDQDQLLNEYLNNIVTVVHEYQPSKIVFDELTPFVGFNNLSLLQDSFLKTIEAIEDFGITSLFILGEPATSFAEKIVDAITAYSTGMIYLISGSNSEKPFNGGRMIIIPNIGHTQGKFSADYSIQPNKGVTTDIVPPAISPAAASEVVSNEARTVSGPGSDVPAKGRKYKPLSDIDFSAGHLTHSNYYDMNDFTLLLNNQIALFKTTGVAFTVLSFRLDREAETKHLLTVIQLQNAVRLSTDRKDKICILVNNVIVLITHEESQIGVAALISKVKTNLPGTDPAYIKSVIPYISVYSVKVNENVHNAHDIIELLVADEKQEKNRLGL